MTEEQKHYHIKEIAEDYVSKSWNTFLDLEEIDLVMAGIGVGKIIASEQEKRIEELEAQIDKMKCCGNCEHYKPVVTVNESISNMCEDYYDGCNNNIYEPYNKWELKEKK